MGCASSAALPFLTTKESQAVVETASANGKPSSYELQMTSNGMGSLNDVNESYISEKMKEVVDSTAVQGVIGGVVQAKEDLCHQVKDAGDAITSQVSSVISGVEDTIESTFDKITGSVSAAAAEEKVKSGIESIEGEVKSLLGDDDANEKITDSVKAEDIDELLNALPSDSEMTSEEVIRQAAEEVKEDAAEN